MWAMATDAGAESLTPVEMVRDGDAAAAEAAAWAATTKAAAEVGDGEEPLGSGSASLKAWCGRVTALDDAGVLVGVPR